MTGQKDWREKILARTKTGEKNWYGKEIQYEKLLQGRIWMKKNWRKKFIMEKFRGKTFIDDKNFDRKKNFAGKIAG